MEMNSKKRNTCPGCGEAGFDVTAPGFALHFNNYCPRHLMKPLLPADGQQSRVSYDRHSDPKVKLNILKAHEKITSDSAPTDPFEFDNNPCDTSLPEPSRQDPTENEEQHPSPTRPIITTQHDAACTRERKRKRSGVPDGTFSFQIQLLDIMQKHGTPMIMHDEIIDLVSTELQSESLRVNGPPLLSREKILKRVEQVF